MSVQRSDSRPHVSKWALLTFATSIAILTGCPEGDGGCPDDDTDNFFIRVISPDNNTAFQQGAVIPFEAQMFVESSTVDPLPSVLDFNYVWRDETLNVDLSNERSFQTANLSLGTHVIRVTATQQDAPQDVTPIQRNVTVTVRIIDEAPASIGDFVWRDDNANGIQDTGEPGVEGVTVVALSVGQDLFSRTTTTGENGQYLFDDLVPGTYTLRFQVNSPILSFTSPDQGADTEDSDVTSVMPLIGSIDGRTEPVTVAAGEMRTDVDAGLIETTAQIVAVTGRVFIDLNGDGIQNPNETGLPGVSVQLVDEDGNEVSTPTLTGENGIYAFGSIPFQPLQVRVALPEDATFSPRDQGGDDNFDSDVAPGTGQSLVFIPTLDIATDIDAGVIPFKTLGDGVIEGSVFDDQNADGVRDDNEPGLEGTTLFLRKTTDDVSLSVTQSDADGDYSFDAVPPGEYYLDLQLNVGYQITVPGLDNLFDPVTGRTDSFFVALDQIVSAINVGIRILDGDGIVSGTVFEDRPRDGLLNGDLPVSEWLVRLRRPDFSLVGPPIMTDDEGRYAFRDLAFGAYVVDFLPFPPIGSLNPIFTTKNIGNDEAIDSDADRFGRTAAFDVDLLGDATGVNAGLIVFEDDAVDAFVGGLVWFDNDNDNVRGAGDALIADVPVLLYNVNWVNFAAMLTDLNGAYGVFFQSEDEDDDLEDVVGVRVGFSVAPEIMFAQPNAGNDETRDSDVDPNTGLADPGFEAIILKGDNDAPVRGNSAVDAGLNGPGPQFVVVGRGNSITGQTFLDPDRNGFPTDGLPFPRVRVRVIALTDAGDVVVAERRTSSLGVFEFFGLPHGMLVVEYDLPEAHAFTQKVQDSFFGSNANPDTGRTDPYDFTNMNSTFSNRSNAGFVRDNDGSATVSGVVWNDGRIGVPDGLGYDDSRVSEVVVELIDGASNVVAITVTNRAGHYAFNAVLPGQYMVRFTPPENFVFTKKDAFISDLIGSDPDEVTGETELFTISAGDTLFFDAGVLDARQIRGFVWRDLDGDGVIEDGEPIVNDIVVAMRRLPTLEVIDQTDTDSLGNYTLLPVVNGPVVIEFIRGSESTFTVQNAGSDPNLDSDANVVTGRAVVANAALNRTPISAGFSAFTAIPFSTAQDAPRDNAISGIVFLDRNRDGLDNDADNDLPGVEVRLYLRIAEGVFPVDTQRSAIGGAYEFPALPDGTYFVEFVPTRNLAITTPGGDSDAMANGRTADVDLDMTNPNAVLNAGLTRDDNGSTTIRGLVWSDINANGLQDAGEPGVPEVSVELLESDATTRASAFTDIAGVYEFNSLLPLTHAVRFVRPPGTMFTEQGVAPEDLNSDPDQLNGVTAFVTPIAGTIEFFDAGLVPTLIDDGDGMGEGMGEGEGETEGMGENGNCGMNGDRSISGIAWIDHDEDGILDDSEERLAGHEMRLLDGNATSVLCTTTTNANGEYAFTGLFANLYHVASTPPPGFGITFPGRGADPLRDNDLNDRVSFGQSIQLLVVDSDATGINAGFLNLCRRTLSGMTNQGAPIELVMNNALTRLFSVMSTIDATCDACPDMTFNVMLSTQRGFDLADGQIMLPLPFGEFSLTVQSETMVIGTILATEDDNCGVCNDAASYTIDTIGECLTP